MLNGNGHLNLYENDTFEYGQVYYTFTDETFGTDENSKYYDSSIDNFDYNVYCTNDEYNE